MEEKRETVRERIIPSAPFKNYTDIEALAEKVTSVLKRIQIDVCDGEFVKNTSWPFTEFSKNDFAAIGASDSVDVYLLHWENINYSADLMCLHPEKYIDSLVTYGIDEIIIHFRSIESNLDVFADITEKAKNFDLNLCLAVDVKTDLEKFISFATENIENINTFQVMGIEKIGFQGQNFDERSLDIVKKLKQIFPDKRIMFDGGLNEETIESCVEAGVDIFCVGSYLTNTENFSENLQVVKNLIRE